MLTNISITKLTLAVWKTAEIYPHLKGIMIAFSIKNKLPAPIRPPFSNKKKAPEHIHLGVSP